MKKNRIHKLTVQTKRNQHEVFKAKRRAKKNQQVQYIKVWKPGPSPAISYDENGKVKGFIKYYGKYQKDSITERGKAAMDANKSVRQSKKDLIKDILKKAGYDPTIRYTRKEKKKFTRVVKNNLFVKVKPVVATEITKPKLSPAELKKQFDEEVRNNSPLPPKEGKQAGSIGYQMSLKEKPNNRKFKYTVQRKCSDNDMKVYDFMTDYFNADTRDAAFRIAKGKAKKFEKDTSFTGITVKDVEGDNSITYYSRNKLLAA